MAERAESFGGHWSSALTMAVGFLICHFHVEESDGYVSKETAAPLR